MIITSPLVDIYYETYMNSIQIYQELENPFFTLIFGINRIKNPTYYKAAKIGKNMGNLNAKIQRTSNGIPSFRLM